MKVVVWLSGALILFYLAQNSESHLGSSGVVLLVWHGLTHMSGIWQPVAGVPHSCM